MIDLAPRSVLADGFLARLRRLLRLRRDHAEEMNAQGVSLMDNCIVATFQDCVRVGAAEEARKIMADVRTAIPIRKGGGERSEDEA